MTGVCHHNTVSSDGTNTCNNTPFCLVFQDEFDGDAIDLSKWQLITGIPRDALTAPHWFKSENVSVANGSLWLSVKQETTIGPAYTSWEPPTYVTRTLEYSAGEVQTLSRFGEGMYVARCRIPDGNGQFWPSFWMYGEDGSSWSSIELDVFEFWGNDHHRWRTNLHRHNQIDCSIHFDAELATELREYTLVWDRFNMYWFRDDLGLVRNTPRWSTILGQALSCSNIPFGLKNLNEEFPGIPTISTNIILSTGMKPMVTMAPNGDIIPLVPDASAFPGAMEVDYVRYYRRVPCLGSPQMHEIDAYLNTNGEYNFLTGVDFTCSTNCTIASGVQVEMSATRSLTFEAGFESMPGSDFIARLGTSNCGQTNGMVLEEDDFYVLQPNLSGGEELPIDTSIAASSGLDIEETSLNEVINWCEGGMFSIEIMDMSGKLVRTLVNVPCGSSSVIDALRIRGGAYIARATNSQGESFYKRIIVAD